MSNIDFMSVASGGQNMYYTNTAGGNYTPTIDQTFPSTTAARLINGYWWPNQPWIWPVYFYPYPAIAYPIQSSLSDEDVQRVADAVVEKLKANQ